MGEARVNSKSGIPSIEKLQSSTSSTSDFSAISKLGLDRDDSDCDVRPLPLRGEDRMFESSTVLKASKQICGDASVLSVDSIDTLCAGEASKPRVPVAVLVLDFLSGRIGSKLDCLSGLADSFEVARDFEASRCSLAV